MKNAWFLLFLLGALSSCQAQQGGKGNAAGAAPVSVLSVPEFKKVITDKNIQLVDVRTPEEYAQGHIDGALNINVNSGDFSALIGKQLDKNKPVAVYCRSGVRSQTASGVLKDLGFKKIYDLKGGFIAWSMQ